MLIPSYHPAAGLLWPSLSRRVNANSQRFADSYNRLAKLIKKGEC